MPYKTTLFFSAGQQGWSESWYMNAATLAAANAQAIGPIVTARTTLLGTGAYIEAVRTVDLSLPGASLFKTFQNGNANPNPNIIRDNVSNAIQARLYTIDPYRRTMWLRGIPDVWISFQVDGSPVIPQANLLGAFNAFIVVLNAAGVGMKVLATGGAQAVFNINGLSVDPNSGQIIVQTSQANGFVQGQFVRINGVQGQYVKPIPPYTEGINGVWQISSIVDPTHFEIPLNVFSLQGSPVWYGGGKARTRFVANNGVPNAPIFPPITSGVIVRFSRKKPGKAFFVPAGKQRAVRRM